MPNTQNRIYALLVGINDYPPSVGKLQGCINDVDHYIETGMNLAALQYDLKLCREHGTYIDLKTLAFAIHHVRTTPTCS